MPPPDDFEPDIPIDEPVAACPLQRWKLFVKVRSLDAGLRPANKIIVRLSQSGKGIWKESKVGYPKSATYSTQAPFEDKTVRTFDITAIFQGEKVTWELVKVRQITTELGKQRVIILLIRVKTAAYLRLGFLDPNTKVRVFPKGLPVRAEFGDGAYVTRRVKGDGFLDLPIHPSRQTFTLRFGMGTEHYVASKPGDPAAATESLTDEAGLNALDADVRYFKLPADWKLKQSVWSADAAGPTHYDAGKWQFNIPENSDIGAEAMAKRVRLTLDPNWQYLRFEFFDRAFGHSADHAHKRVSIPLIPIEGYYERPTAAPAPEPDTRSRWMVDEADKEKACHSLPWIIQRKDDAAGTSAPKPDKRGPSRRPGELWSSPPRFVPASPRAAWAKVTDYRP